MKYDLYAKALWFLFARSFRRALSEHWDADRAAEIMKRARPLYQKLVRQTPGIGGMRENPLTVNLLSACQFASIYLAADKSIPVKTMTKIYNDGMLNGWLLKAFIRRQDMFSEENIRRKMEQAEKSQTSPYAFDWKWTFEVVDDGHLCANYTKCGILELFRSLGIEELTPAMCAFDYPMTALSGATFRREYTLASGGPVCDCHYIKKQEDASRSGGQGNFE